MISATFNLINDTKKTDHEFKGGQLGFLGQWEQSCCPDIERIL